MEFVRRFVRRMVYRNPGVYHNPLMHPFLLITAATGIAFVFFGHTEPVQASVLYQLTLAHLPDISASIWGVVAMLLFVTHLVAVQVRKPWLGAIVTWTGFGLWLYATLLFALYGFWLQFFTGGIPNLFFWTWYLLFVKTYHETHEESP